MVDALFPSIEVKEGGCEAVCRFCSLFLALL